jgi:sugar transferase (PEP-CTERM/EpsH1 system associated)
MRVLSQRYRIHLGCFIDNPEDEAFIQVVKGYCDETNFTKLNKVQILWRSLIGMLKGDPLSVAAYNDRSMHSWVRSIIKRREIDRILVFSSCMAQFVDDDEFLKFKPIIDFVDVDSDKWRIRSERNRWPLRYLFKREADKLQSHDRAVAGRFGLALFVAETETALFRLFSPDTVYKTHVVPNGLDVDYFSPDVKYPDPFDGRPTVVFCGALNYWPNEDAVVWFAHKIFPLLKEDAVNVNFAVVGRAPKRRVLGLEKIEGLNIVGTVPDVRPYLANASIIVVPLQDSPGVANKVLEGMAMAKPVVATTKAMSGLMIKPGSEVIIADEPETFATAIADILNGRLDGKRLGQNARQRILTDYDWGKALARLPRLIEDR